MMVGTRLALLVAKVTTTVATHRPRPVTKIRSQPGPVRCGRRWGSRVATAAGPSAAVCVMVPLLVLAQGSRHDWPASSQPAAISPAGWLESRLPATGDGRYPSSPATRLMVVARMTAPSRYDSSAWRNAAARNAELWSAV